MAATLYRRAPGANRGRFGYRRHPAAIDLEQAKQWYRQQMGLTPAKETSGVVFDEDDFPGSKTVDGVAEVDGRRSAFFKDSEGNLIGMIEYI